MAIVATKDHNGPTYFLASRNESTPFRQPATPEAERWALLDHVEHRRDLRKVEIVLRLPRRVVQRVQQHLRPLAIGTHGACHREEDDGKGNENTEHHAEGIEKLVI